jgi:hypothetical protein
MGAAWGSICEWWSRSTFKDEVTLGDVATSFLAVITILALCVAWYQLRGFSRQTRASVLLALDERWESGDLVLLREDLEIFIREVVDEAKRRSTPQRPVTTKEIFPERLEALRTADPDRHLRLFRLCGFFESMAYAARERYIRTSDLYNLLGVSIRDTGAVFRQHIVNRQSDWNTPQLFEHYVWLIDQVRKRDRQRWWRGWL